jgi:hypothetical protein
MEIAFGDLPRTYRNVRRPGIMEIITGSYLTAVFDLPYGLRTSSSFGDDTRPDYDLHGRVAFDALKFTMSRPRVPGTLIRISASLGHFS